MFACLRGCGLLLVMLLPIAKASADSGVGIGVLGDSYSDEYQFYPPHRSTARNWVEILAATRGLNFGSFTPVSRGEPRNQGFAYNWARSDATTDDLIALGQHLGLAAQVAQGEVKFVFVFVGGNDFIHALRSPDPLAKLEEVGPRVARNHRIAVETILAADPGVKLVVATLPDIRSLPEFAEPIRNGRLAAPVVESCTRAIRAVNNQIRLLALGHRRIALVDLDLLTRMTNRERFKGITLMGRRLDWWLPGDEIDHFFLADGRHMGTLGHGLIAQLFIETVNRSFDAGIAPLSDQEVLRYATGLAPTMGVAEIDEKPGP
jgi:phospholipase/lecithinase/hemolysin